MTSLTPDLAATILESVRHGTPPRQAAIAAGISDETLRRWQKIAAGETTWLGQGNVAEDTRTLISVFCRDLAQAQASMLQVVHGSAYFNATTPNEKTGHYDTQSIREILGKHPASRDDWYERKHSTVDSVVTHRVEDQLAEGASLDQLKAWSSLPELPEGHDATAD